MKISHLIILSGLLVGFYSCKDDKKATSEEQTQEVKQDTLSEEVKPAVKPAEISLEPVQSDVPSFTNPEAKAFVDKTKKYFEEVAEATKKGDTHKIVELQLQASDIDTEFQKIKGKLNAEQQKQLTDWYMKLVKAASE